MRFLILLLVLISAGCKIKKTESAKSPADNVAIVAEERIIDSTSFGAAGHFKIDIQQVIDAEGGHYVEFEWFEKKNNQWISKQHLKEEKDGITSLDPIFSDFNNDGLKDMTFRSAVAARGANEIRTLFLFDKSSGKLVKIKNSSEYPNLRYNDELDCLDAWMVYAGSSTVFLKIEGDSLKEFAGIDLFDGLRTIYEVDDRGKQNILKEDSIDEFDVYTRYKNYKTLKVNQDN